MSLSQTSVGEGLADTKPTFAGLLDAIGAPTWSMGLDKEQATHADTG